ncbi:hypothetical protein IX51_10800 [uncultured archaeon]|nr:hypothetical protein IX51_10800 [uncultured archaeon]
MRIVVIGGDAAGMSAASRARKALPDSEVVVYEAGNFVSYSACGIPFYVSGEVEEFDELLHYPMSKFRDERRIDVRVRSRVTKIMPERKQIVVLSDGKESTDKFDRLVIATGARPRIPGIFEGKKLVYTMRNLDDLNTLMGNINGMKEVIIVGAGYVGLEMAEAFASRGIHVAIFQRSGKVLRGLDGAFSEMIVEELTSKGVEVHLNSPVEAVDESSGEGISVKSGSFRASADMVFLSVGVVPNSEVASGSGIALDSGGAIKVDRTMQTSIKGIYAAGDVATTYERVGGMEIYFPLATGSNRSGRIAGTNAAGGNIEYKGITKTEVVKVFSLNVARTGLNEEEAMEAGFDPVSSTITASSRASYYPGAEELRIKLVGDRKTHRLLGCVMLGKEGVAKRIDVAAAALYAGLTVEDMTGIDYSYSPPFAPAWEPLGVAADVLVKKMAKENS